MEPAKFDPERLLTTLVAHDVRFVLIGGWAAKALGSPSVTADIDICYDRDPANLRKLAAALAELGPRLRGVTEKVPFVADERTLRAGDHFTLATNAGDLDLLGTPAGAPSFAELERAASSLELGDVRVRVASIEDLIAMKRAAGRPKDLVEIQILGALREEIDRATRSRGGG